MAEHFYYSIASGSSGNCGLYVSDGTAVLIDVGVSLQIPLLHQLRIHQRQHTAVLLPSLLRHIHFFHTPRPG